MATSSCFRLRPRLRRPWRRIAAIAVFGVIVALAPCAAARAAGADERGAAAERAATASTVRDHDWRWPLEPFRLTRAYVAPPHPYGPGHRGIDMVPGGEAVVLSPAAGIVAFAGQVAGRGVVTIDHGGGLVSTLEPIDPVVSAGSPVAASEPLGTVSSGGHVDGGALHLGVRLDGEYINPLVLLGTVPRAVLLPCC